MTRPTFHIKPPDDKCGERSKLLPEQPARLTHPMEIPCYVISLPESNRRSTISSSLDAQGIRFKFVDGVRIDSKQMQQTYSWQRFRRRYGRNSTPNEVACVLAHQKVYERILSGSAAAAIILEDDAILDPLFAEVAGAAASRIRQGDVTLLEQRGDVLAARRGSVDLPRGHRLAYLHRKDPLGAVAQIVTRTAAKRLRTFGDPVRSTPDDWFLFSRRVVVRAVIPPVAHHDQLSPSEIGLDRFAAELDPPRFTERIRHHTRTSRIWRSQTCRELRELALLQRAAAIRTFARW